MSMDTGPIAVLLIEDNPDDTVLIRRYLTAAGQHPCRVEHAGRLCDGLECLKRGGIDAVLLDLDLPDGKGFETFNQVISLAPRVPVIVLTGHDDDDFAIEAVRRGAQDYLVKGQVTGSLLRRALRHAIDRMKMLTDLRQAQEALRAGETKLRNITAVIGEGIYVLDCEGRLTFMNPEAEKLLGWTEAELFGRNIHEAVHSLTRDGAPLAAADCPVLKTIRTGETYRDEDEVFLRKDGSRFPAAVVATPLRDNGRIVGSVTAFQDITERKRAAEELTHLNKLLAAKAATDPLTGIANRLKFNDTLSAEVRRARRYSLPLSLIMFDIDGFKRINDTSGHLAGDGVLRELAALVAGNVRLHDLFARWGGEEFMIMVTNSTLDHAVQFAEKLRLLIEGHGFPGAGRMTCSFGVAQFVPGETEDRFTQRVDAALYRAKAAGRNRTERAS